MNLQTMKDVKAHLFSEISRYGALDTHSILESQGIDDPEGRRHVFTIFTDRNEYRICVRLPTQARPDGGLSCGSLARKPRAGETWRRGNDLPDGPLTHETWHRILASIVSYEMVQISREVLAPVIQSAASPVDGSAEDAVATE
jgi:hypothetical protein